MQCRAHRIRVHGGAADRGPAVQEATPMGRWAAAGPMKDDAPAAEEGPSRDRSRAWTMRMRALLPPGMGAKIWHSPLMMTRAATERVRAVAEAWEDNPVGGRDAQGARGQYARPYPETGSLDTGRTWTAADSRTRAERGHGGRLQQAGGRLRQRR